MSNCLVLVSLRDQPGEGSMFWAFLRMKEESAFRIESLEESSDIVQYLIGHKHFSGGDNKDVEKAVECFDNWMFPDSNDKSDGDSLGDEGQLMWVRGQTGSGKSSLLKAMINNKQLLINLGNKYGKAGLLWHFISANDTPGGSSVEARIKAILGSLLCQFLKLVENSKACASVAEGWLPSVSQKPMSSWSVQDLMRGLKHGIQASTFQFVVLLDGLEEIGSPSDGSHERIMGSVVLKLAAIPGLRMIVSSCEHPAFVNFLSGFSIIYMRDLTQPAIRTFIIDTTVGLEAFSARYFNNDGDGKKFNDFVEHVCKLADGVFLWAHMAIHTLRFKNPGSGAGWREQLDGMPKNVCAAYKHRWAQIDHITGSRGEGSFRRLAALCLNLVMAAEAEGILVSPYDLAKATSIDARSRGGNGIGSTLDNSLEDASKNAIKWLLVGLGGLLAVQDMKHTVSGYKWKVVKLAHASVKTYLQSEEGRREILSHDTSTPQQRWYLLWAGSIAAAICFRKRNINDNGFHIVQKHIGDPRLFLSTIQHEQLKGNLTHVDAADVLRRAYQFFGNIWETGAVGDEYIFTLREGRHLFRRWEHISYPALGASQGQFVMCTTILQRLAKKHVEGTGFSSDFITYLVMATLASPQSWLHTAVDGNERLAQYLLHQYCGSIDTNFRHITTDVSQVDVSRSPQFQHARRVALTTTPFSTSTRLIFETIRLGLRGQRQADIAAIVQSFFLAGVDLSTPAVVTLTRYDTAARFQESGDLYTLDIGGPASAKANDNREFGEPSHYLLAVVRSGFALRLARSILVNSQAQFEPGVLDMINTVLGADQEDFENLPQIEFAAVSVDLKEGDSAMEMEEAAQQDAAGHSYKQPCIPFWQLQNGVVMPKNFAITTSGEDTLQVTDSLWQATTRCNLHTTRAEELDGIVRVPGLPGLMQSIRDVCQGKDPLAETGARELRTADELMDDRLIHSRLY